MFISKEDKQRIETLLDAARNKIAALEARITVLEKATTKLAKVNKLRKVLTPEQKAKNQEYMKAYNARKRAEKIAQKGNTNVSA